MEAADIPAYDGWHAWRISAGQSLADLRDKLLAGHDLLASGVKDDDVGD